MRLLIFYCLLLASIALALPNGRNKRDLAYLKNLMKSAIFGRSKINIQPQTDIKEENGYKVFRLPGYEDIMIKVSPKKPVIEEFVYPAKVEKVNLNAFGSVVGTKTKDDTLAAVKEVNNLLSTGILYGGHNNVIKETVVPMFPSLNTPNFVLEENIETASVIEAKPVLKEVKETRPVLKEVIKTRPVLTEVKETRPVLKEVIKTRPVLTEVKETRPVLKEVIKTRPVLTEVKETKPVLKEVIKTRPVLTEVIEARPVLKEVIETKPVLTEVIRPLEERVELKVPFEPTYSYKQMQNNEAVMTFTAHNNPGVEVLETLKMKTELPMCIKKRVDEAIVLGTDPIRFAPAQEVFQYENPPVIDFSYPRLEANSFIQDAIPNWFTPVQELNHYQTAPIMDFSYPRVDTNSYGRNSFREEVLAEGFETVADFRLTPQRVRPLKYSPVRYNLGPRKIQPINPRPVPLHLHKSLHVEADISASKDKVNSQTRKVEAFNNLSEKVDIAQTLGPIPPQYITHVANKTGNVAVSNEKIMKKLKAVPIVGSKDNIANAKIPVDVYKSQSNPNTGKVLKETKPLRTNVETSFNEYIATHVLAAKKDNAQMKNAVFTNKGTLIPPIATRPVIVDRYNVARQPLKDEIQTSIKNEVTSIPPIATRPVIVDRYNVARQPLKDEIQTSIKSTPVVLNDNKNYSYQQKHADGSSINVKGNKDGVAVNIKENNNRGRGDIPDQ